MSSEILLRVTREDKLKLAKDFGTLSVILRALSHEKDREIRESALNTLRIAPQVKRAVYEYLNSFGDEKSAVKCCGILRDCGLSEDKVAELIYQAEVCRQGLSTEKVVLREQKKGKGIA